MFHRILVALGGAVLAWSSPAAALGDLTIYDNAQSVPIGGRAAGMDDRTLSTFAASSALRDVP